MIELIKVGNSQYNGYAITKLQQNGGYLLNLKLYIVGSTIKDDRYYFIGTRKITTDKTNVMIKMWLIWLAMSKMLGGED